MTTAIRRVVSKIDRVDEQIVARFAQFYTGIVLDEMGKHGALGHHIGPLSPGMRVCGPAVTQSGADLSVRRMAIDLAEPGDVLVVAAGGIRDRACFGDGTARRMQVKGLAGAVIDGSVRDAAGIRGLGFPTFCIDATPRNYHYPYEGEAGGVNVPVVVSGVVVEPGDLVLGDDDGVVIVPKDLAAQIAPAVAGKLELERSVRNAWTGYEPFGLRGELEQRGYVFD